MSEALEQAAEFNRYFTSTNGVDVGARVSVPRDEWRTLYAALSQPAPSQQPAVPVLSDEQIRTTVESIQDPDTVPAFHNGYYTLTPDELRRAILALRPQAVPMTLDHIWANDGIMSANGIIGFKFDAVIRIVRAVEAHHGITAKAEGGA